MKKLKEYLKNDLCFAFCLSLLFLLISVILFKPFFEEIDDTHIAMLSEGVYGVREAHLIYTNVILGYLYKALLSLFPALRWHSVIQYMLIFASYLGINRLLAGKEGGRMLSLLFSLATFYELYVSLQYTKTAVFAVSAGLILLLDNVHRLIDDKMDTGRLVFSCILVISGALLRDMAFYIALVFTGLTGLYELYKNKHIKAYIKVFIPLLLTVIACFVIDRAVYASDPGWASFMEFNEQRTKVTDYRYDLLDYPSRAKELKEAGISENDSLICLTWQFGDDKVFDSEFFRSVIESGPKRRIGIKMLKEFAEHLYEQLFVPGAFILFMVVFTAFMLLFGKGGREDKIYVILVFLGAMAAFFYYQYSGRWSHRLIYASLIPMMLGFMYEYAKEDASLKEGHTDATKTTLVIFTVLLTYLSVGSLLKNRFDYNDYRRTKADVTIEEAYMEANADKLFVTDTFTFQNAYVYDVFRAGREGSLKNAVCAGSWYTNCPVTKEITRRFGYENPYEALRACDEDVLLIDNCFADEKVTFMNEHSDRDYEAVLLEERNGYKSYGIRETGN